MAWARWTRLLNRALKPTITRMGRYSNPLLGGESSRLRGLLVEPEPERGRRSKQERNK